MKTKTLMAFAVAGTLACGGALAGGMHHGNAQGGSVEALTPSSVSESAPWLTNTPHSAGWAQPGSTSTVIGMQEGLHSDGPVGASASVGGSGEGGFDSLSSSASGFDSSLTGYDYSLSGTNGVEYWLWGDGSYGTGTSSSLGGSGSGGYDSMSSVQADDSLASSGQYIVWGPLSQADAEDLFLIEADADNYSGLTLSALSEGYSLLTPIYDEMADASSFHSDAHQVSQYSPLSGEEDLAT